jgi:hypothetical protein
MEGTMKMMSWSRYQCLSKSLSRVAEHGRRAAKMLKTRQRSRAPHPLPPARGAGSAPARYFLFVIRLFRNLNLVRHERCPRARSRSLGALDDREVAAGGTAGPDARTARAELGPAGDATDWGLSEYFPMYPEERK